MRIQDGDNMGNPAQARHRREAHDRNAANDLPGVLTAPEEENGSVPERDVHGGRSGLALSPLQLERGRVLR